MLLVITERQRIDDAAAGEGQPGLAGQPGMILDETEPRRLSFEQAGVDQASDGGRVYGAIAHPAGCGLHLHQRFQPEQAARAGADDLDGHATCGGLGGDGLGDLVGAHRQGGDVTGHEDAGHRAPSRTAALRRWESSRPTGFPSTRAEGATAQRPRQ